jgi:hypothetical protein
MQNMCNQKHIVACCKLPDYTRMGKGRRFLQGSTLNDLPTPGENEKVVKIINTPGNNLLEVEDGDGSKFTCRIPKRFRNLIWVKRGLFFYLFDFCI